MTSGSEAGARRAARTREEIAGAQLDDCRDDRIVRRAACRGSGHVAERAQHRRTVEAGHALDHSEVRQGILRRALEVLALPAQSSLERAHVAGAEAARDERTLLRRRGRRRDAPPQARTPGETRVRSRISAAPAPLPRQSDGDVDDRLRRALGRRLAAACRGARSRRGRPMRGTRHRARGEGCRATATAARTRARRPSRPRSGGSRPIRRGRGARGRRVRASAWSAKAARPVAA